MKRKIRRRCKCGCGGITNYDKIYVSGHNNARKGTGKRKIRRQCACGCNKITASGKRFISGHNSFGNTFARKHKKIRRRCKCGCGRITKYRKRYISGHNSFGRMQYDPNYPYCDIWKDEEYRNDIRKDYCENLDCKNDYKQLDNHHVHLDKKRCAPSDIITLCHPCHLILHHRLERGQRISASLKDYIIINRPDHVSYIYKRSRKIITIKRKIYDNI